MIMCEKNNSNESNVADAEGSLDGGDESISGVAANAAIAGFIRCHNHSEFSMVLQ